MVLLANDTLKSKTLKSDTLKNAYFGRIFLFAASLLVAGLLAGAVIYGGNQAMAQDRGAQINDPLEGVNRAVFSFNLAIEKAVLRPVAKGYQAATPVFVQDRVDDFLKFLKSPIILVNNILQGDVEGAMDTTARFITNGTIGLFGLIDVMEPKIAYRDEDFGQTLAVWGVDNGAYLVLPLLGPSNARDVGGRIVDGIANPVPGAVERQDMLRSTEYSVANGVVTGISFLSKNYERLERLEETSLDYYAAIRSLYQQNRQNQIHNGAHAQASAETEQESNVEIAWE